MSILDEESEIKSSFSSDISVDQVINSVDVSYLVGKAVENLITKGGGNNELEEHEVILNSIRLLVAELEENQAHAKTDWVNSKIMRYIQNLD